jgi:hypothetical protein
VLTSNTTAEYGRNSGAQVAMVTRSGTNEFHGGLFWFYRTPRLNANEWENNIDALGKRQFVQHTFGGSIGGPIVKNKTFFFSNVQLLRAVQTQTQSPTVYTAEARKGMLRSSQTVEPVFVVAVGIAGGLEISRRCWSELAGLVPRYIAVWLEFGPIILVLCFRGRGIAAVHDRYGVRQLPKIELVLQGDIV